MTPKQQAFQDMRESGLDTRVFDFEVLLCGFRFDGRMTNGRKKKTKKSKVKLEVRKSTKVKPFCLMEIEGGFVVRL